ncbi:MFAP2 protein, partial [Polypterus senegalus]
MTVTAEVSKPLDEVDTLSTNRHTADGCAQEIIKGLDLDCREEQYPCTRLYSVHKPCRQCIKSLCFYNLRRVYVINKEVCVRTVCAHEELLRADLCRDQFSKCSVMAHTGMCGALGSSCAKSCGGC